MNDQQNLNDKERMSKCKLKVLLEIEIRKSWDLYGY